MIQKCETCGIKFNSEGHDIYQWLTQCLQCNEKRRANKVNPLVDKDIQVKQGFP